jgi:hypothetical protein
LTKRGAIPVEKGNEHIRNEIVSRRVVYGDSERVRDMFDRVDNQSYVTIAKATPSFFAPREAVKQ